MRRILLVAAVLVLCVAAAAVFAPRRLGEALFARGVAAGVNRDVGASLPDGLHVALCGTGSPMADPTRAGPCTAVIAGQRLFIVDIGSGAARKLGPMGLNIGTVDGLFLTHFHSDHIDGLGELMTLRWATGNRARPLPVYGPTGVDRVTAGFNAAYALDQTYRIAHHGAAVVPPAGRGVVPRSFAADGPVVVFDAGGVRVTAFPVTHEPVTPAVGYRFDYKERSVVVSGDTAPDRRIAVAAKGADLLVHEALNADMVRLLGRRLAAAGRSKPAKVMSDILSYHASPEDAATTAAQAGAGMLVLTHIVPPLPTRLLDSYFLGDAADRFGGPIVVGRDGMLFSLPSGSREIGRRDLE